jgi:hypothetical protein
MKTTSRLEEKRDETICMIALLIIGVSDRAGGEITNAREDILKYLREYKEKRGGYPGYIDWLVNFKSKFSKGFWNKMRFHLYAMKKNKTVLFPRRISPLIAKRGKTIPIYAINLFTDKIYTNVRKEADKNPFVIRAKKKREKALEELSKKFASEELKRLMVEYQKPFEKAVKKAMTEAWEGIGVKWALLLENSNTCIALNNIWEKVYKKALSTRLIDRAKCQWYYDDDRVIDHDNILIAAAIGLSFIMENRK